MPRTSKRNTRESLDVSIAQPSVVTQTARRQAARPSKAEQFYDTLVAGTQFAQQESARNERDENLKAKAAASSGKDFEAEYRSSEEQYDQIKLGVDLNKRNQDWYKYAEENAADLEELDANSYADKYEEFIRSGFAGMNDAHEELVLNGFIAKSKAQVRLQAIKRDVAELNTERVNTATEYVAQLATNDTDGFTMAEAVKALSADGMQLFTEDGQKVKLTSDQKEQVLVNALTQAAVAKSDASILDILNQKQPNGSAPIASNPAFKTQIKAARQQADQKRMLGLQFTIDKLTDRGQFDFELGLEALDAGVPYQFVLSQLNRNLSGQTDKINSDYILGLLKDGRAMEHVKPKDVQKVIDQNYDIAFQEEDDGKMLAVTKEAVKNGFIPVQVKQLLKTITPNANPEALARARSFYNEVKRFDNKLALNRLDDKTVATMEFLNTSIEVGGMSPEQALQLLDVRDDKLAKTTVRSVQGREALLDAISDVTDFPYTIDDIEQSVFLEKRVDDLMAIASGSGYTKPSEAAKWAVERLHSTNDEVNGRLIPKAMFPSMGSVEDGLIDFVENKLKFDSDDYDIRLPANYQETGEIVIAPKGVSIPQPSHRYKASDINQWFSNKSKTEAEKRAQDEALELAEEKKSLAFKAFLSDAAPGLNLSDPNKVTAAIKDWESLNEEGRKKWIEKAINEENINRAGRRNRDAKRREQARLTRLERGLAGYQ